MRATLRRNRCALRLLIAFAVGPNLAACRPAPTAAPPSAAADASSRSEQDSRFDPIRVSDAPLSVEECRMFGELRASDPQEPETSELYAEECIEMTELEPPWMRRTTRCMIQTKTDEDRALCFTAAMDDDASPSGRLEQLERRQRELEQERVRLEREQRELQLEIEHERQRLLVEEEEP